MRNFKKFLALVMAMLMLVSVAVISTGAADADGDYTDAAQHLAAIKILKGDENGNLNLEGGVTRYQAALFFVQAITGRTDVAVWNAEKKSTVFTDVPEYGTAIDYAAGINLILGRGNGVYGYNDPIMYQDMLVMSVRALGYETADMSYPYGYILAAQKLGITEDVDNVNYKAELTRGETSQIIWNMLNTQIAVEDPLKTGVLLYPDELGSYPLFGDGTKTPERVTLLEEAEFADGKIETMIVEFVEADEDDEDSVDTVILDGGIEVAAADLGITADTLKTTYLGLPVTLFVDCEEDEFEAKYDINPEDSDASIVFASYEKYTTVENLGDAGNIRLVVPTSGDPYMMLGSLKATDSKFEYIDIYVFDDSANNKGWQHATEQEWYQFAYNFLYTTKDGYKYAQNTYGKVDYRSYTYIEEDGSESEVLEILYTPYTFGQYFARNIAGTSYTTIATYADSSVENFDKVDSYFVEKLAGTNSTVSSSTTSVSNRNGKLAKATKTAGESVKSGDFMFYNYNQLDNVLTVAQNCGTFQTGKLTGVSKNAETVKIGGTNYKIGFKGAVATDMPATYDALSSTVTTILNKDLTDTDNARYIVVDGQVVYLESYSGTTTSGAEFDFAIVSIDPEKVADVLNYKNLSDFADDYTVVEYEGNRTFALDNNGYIMAAILNKDTGKWEIKAIEKISVEYDLEDEKYATTYNIATLGYYVDNLGSAYTKSGDFEAAYDALTESAILALVKEDNGVYALGALDSNDTADMVDFHAVEGLVFSDVNTRTNKLSASYDVDPARVVTDGDTILVAIDADGNVGVRVGSQKAKYSITGNATCYAASSSLIVVEFTGSYSFDASVDYETVEDWSKTSSAASSSETYYYLIDGSEISSEKIADDEYTISLTRVLDLRTLELATADFTSEEMLDSDDVVFYVDDEGTLTAENMTVVDAFIAAQILENEDLTEINPAAVRFVDQDTFGLNGTSELVASITGQILTVFEIGNEDLADYDLASAMITAANLDSKIGTEAGEGILFIYDEIDDTYTYTDTNGDEIEMIPVYLDGDRLIGFEYDLDDTMINEFDAPEEGIINQMILDFAAESGLYICIPENDATEYQAGIVLTTYIGVAAEVNDDGEVTISVIKTFVEIY